MENKKRHLCRSTPTAVALLTEEDDDVTTASSLSTSIGLSDDLLSEILVRCSFKSLVRFRSVSKRWFSLISSPIFYVLRNSRLSGILLRKSWPSHSLRLEFVSPKSSLSRDPPPPKSLNFVRSDRDFAGVDILQSCNGLLLCTGVLPKLGGARGYFVVNPTTRQYIEFYAPHHACGLHIAFDPSKSHHYKIVCVSSVEYSTDSYSSPGWINIYSSENRRWVVSGNRFMVRGRGLFTQGVFWNGSIHWIRAWSRFNIDSQCIEELPALPGPRQASHTRESMLLSESNGHLHLIDNLFTIKFQVFEMKSDYSGWFVKYHVDLEGVVAAFPPIVDRYLECHAENCGAFSILGVIRKENEDESLLLMNVPDKVLSYSFKDGTWKELLDLVTEEIYVRPGYSRVRRTELTKDDAFHFIESLALV